MGQKKIKGLVATLAVVLFVATASMAYAGGSPAGDQYGPGSTQATLTPPQQQQVAGQQTQLGGTLPNTGLSLLVTLVGGLALIGAGVLIRRSARQSD